MTAAMMALDLHTVAAPALMPAMTEPTTHSKLEMKAPKAMTTVVNDKLECQFDYANESVQYHHHFDGDSCHGCIDHVSVLGKSLPSVRPSFTIPFTQKHDTVATGVVARKQSNKKNSYWSYPPTFYTTKFIVAICNWAGNCCCRRRQWWKSTNLPSGRSQLACFVSKGCHPRKFI